jgi:hypothetical protein
MGEGEDGGGQSKDPLAPLPFIPSHQGRGDFWCVEKMLEESSQF